MSPKGKHQEHVAGRRSQMLDPKAQSGVGAVDLQGKTRRGGKSAESMFYHCQRARTGGRKSMENPRAQGSRRTPAPFRIVEAYRSPDRATVDPLVHRRCPHQPAILGNYLICGIGRQIVNRSNCRQLWRAGDQGESHARHGAAVGGLVGGR